MNSEKEREKQKLCRRYCRELRRALACVPELRERSHEKFTLLETSMYPTLYRLQDNGYISAREELVGKRRKRTYYHLEPAGRTYFQKIFAEYMTVQQGVQEILTSCQEEVTDIEP